LRADFTVVDENDQPISGATVTAKLIEWVPGSGFTAEETVDLSTLVVDPTINRHYFHPLDGEFNTWAQLTGL